LVIAFWRSKIALPNWTLSIITVSYASIESNTSPNSEETGPVIPSGSSTHFPVPPDSIKAGLEHINNAQEAMQNGDTEGANNHLEMAKESLSKN
jgi:hypothetical protein